MWSILENVPCALEKKLYFSAFGWNVLKISVRSISSNVSFKTCVSLLIFCFDELSIGLRVVLKSPTIVLLSSLSKFKKIEIISNKIDLKIKITRDKEGHYIMVKGSIQQEDITIVNIYAPNIGVPQYIRQTLTDIKGETGSNTIIVEVFNTALTPMDRSSQQKIDKETQVLNDTLDEMDLTDIFRTFHPNAEEYTFFSSAHGAFSRIVHTLGHK